MLKFLAKFAVERWPFVILSLIAFAMYGWTCFRALPIEAFPDVTDPMVEVVGLYPGQAAEEVERRVTVELERVLAGTPKLIDLRSVSVFGLTLITLTFQEKTTDFELRTLVAERLRDAALPSGAETIMGPQATPVGQIYRYTMRGPRSLKELRALQDFVVERRLRAVPGVADVVTFGGFQRNYQIRVDPSKLAAFGVSLKEIYGAIEDANDNAGGGYVGIGSQEFVVRSIGTIQNPDELGQAVIRVSEGIPIRVRDVAEIVDGSTSRRGSVGRGLATDVVEGIVLLRRGENPSVVLDALHQRIDLLNTEILPKDVQISTFYDRTDLVNSTLSTVGRNLVEGVLLVLFVVYVFLRSLRAVIIIAVVIPVSMLSAFVGLKALGLPANLISLGAIDFGILVDGAIIVIEGTLHAIVADPQKERRSLIQDAVEHVSKPVLFSMLIIIVALAPIFSLERVEGRIFAPMAFTYTFALLGALVSAMFIVPALESVLMRGKLNAAEPHWIGLARQIYLAILDFLLLVRYCVIALFLAAVGGMAWFASGIGTEFLPELNEGGFYITSVFPSTVSLDETRDEVALMRELILQTPEVRDVLTHIGRPEQATQAEGPNNAEFFVILDPEHVWRKGYDRRAVEQELRDRLATIPGARHNFSQPITDRVFETISGIIGQVVVKIKGSDLIKMTDIAEDVRSRLANVEGVTDLALYQAGDVPALRIDLNREAMARRGLTVDQVQETIRVAMGGESATELWDNERRFPVTLRLPDSIRSNPDALGRLFVGPANSRISLQDIATITQTQGRSSIWREDFTRFVAVKFNVRGRDLGSTVEAARQATTDIDLPEGTYLTWGGEFQNQKRAMRRLTISLPIALAVIVAMLYANFRSWKPTATIFAFLPAAVVGAIAGLNGLGENFSVSSAVGCIALLGQIVLSGVIICSSINDATDEHADRALLVGAGIAFRPVLLTSALAALGLIPAALSHSMGSETQRPFAISIVSGLMVGTPAVLFVMPLVYSVVMGLRRPRPPKDAVTKSASVPAVPPDSTASKSGIQNCIRWGGAGLSLLLSLGGASATGQSPIFEGVPFEDTIRIQMADRRDLAYVPPSPDTVLLKQTFSLRDAIDYARQTHPRIQAAVSAESASANDAIAAGLWQNPVIDFIHVKAVRNSSYDSFGAPVLVVSQFIESSRRPQAKRLAALHMRDAVSAHREGVQLDVDYDVEAAFVALGAQYRLLAINNMLVSRLTDASRIVNLRVTAGTAARYDSRRLQIAKAEAISGARTREAVLAEVRGELEVAVGPYAEMLQGEPELNLEELPPLPELETLLATTDAGQRGLRSARSVQQSFISEVDVARRSIVPGFEVRAYSGYGQAPGQLDFGAGIAVPLPLINRGQGSIAAAEFRAVKAGYDVHALSLAAQQQVRAQLHAVEHRYDAVRRFQEETEGLDERLMVESTARYRDARMTILELVDAFQSVTQIGLMRVELLRDARIAEIDLRRQVTTGSKPLPTQ